MSGAVFLHVSVVDVVQVCLFCRFSFDISAYGRMIISWMMMRMMMMRLMMMRMMMRLMF